MKRTNLLFFLSAFLFTCLPLFAAAPVKDDRAAAYFHYMLGAVKENSRDYPGAIDEYKEALKHDPEASDIFARLASLYAQTDRLDEATADAQKASYAGPGLHAKVVYRRRKCGRHGQSHARI
jgi:tetratricopeptide (TPR) repeat protein